jgi:small-conductance mechanosensitive channel
VAKPLTSGELNALVHGLLQPGALIEAGALVVALILAWLVVRLARGPHPRPDSIWFGNRVVDGVLFPVLSLLLAFAARLLLPENVPGAVFRLALPILTSLVAIRLTVKVLRKAFPRSRVMRIFERSVSWIAWLGVVLWITGVLPLLLAELDAIHWKLGTSQLSLRNLLEGLLSAVIVLVVALWISAAIESRLLKSAGAHDLSVRKIAANAVRAVLLFIGLMFALSAAGIDLTALGVLGGAVGVGVGFGLQKLASNYVSGFVILAERAVRIGDMIKVDNFEGRITDIKTRYTVVRALNGRESIVPNEMFIIQRVENSSLADPKMEVKSVVLVPYGTDLDTLAPRLLAAVREVPRVLSDPPPQVQLESFAERGLEIAIVFVIEDPLQGTANVRSEVNFAVLRVLNHANIEIPYPQQVVRQFAPEK